MVGEDSWRELRCGSVVVRELPPGGDWLMSWYPHQGDPNYPGFSLVLSERGVTIDGGPTEVVAWAATQDWAQLCDRESSASFDVRVVGKEPDVVPLDVP